MRAEKPPSVKCPDMWVQEHTDQILNETGFAATRWPLKKNRILGRHQNTADIANVPHDARSDDVVFGLIRHEWPSLQPIIEYVDKEAIFIRGSFREFLQKLWRLRSKQCCLGQLDDSFGGLLVELRARRRHG